MPALLGFDHLHVYVSDRRAAEAWYGRVLGLSRTGHLEHWAADGGPLTLQDPAGLIHLALFERPGVPSRATLALRVSAAALKAWQAHLSTFSGLEVRLEDHGEAVSLYFSDPDGNPYELTTYEVDGLEGR